MNHGLALAGVDWKEIFQSIPAYATANAMALALSPVAGSTPRVINRGDFYEITFTAEQADRVSAWILMQLNKEPGPVRVDTARIAWSVVSRKYWPYFAGAVGAGVLIGWAMKGKR